MVTKLSPPKIVGFMMGVWSFATAMGNYVAGWVAGLVGHRSYSEVFMIAFVTAAVVTLILAFHDSDHQAIDGRRALKTFAPQRHRGTEDTERKPLCSLCLCGDFYFPLHTGVRFSVKAISPSFASSVAISSSR